MRIEHNPGVQRLGALGDEAIDVVNGMVTLRGTVDTPEAKADALRVAADTDGVKKINNLLRVHAG